MRASPLRLFERRRTVSWAHELGDGAATTVHLASYSLRSVSPRLVRLDPPQPLAAWCAGNGAADALIGGFFVRPRGLPLGELWLRGERRPAAPFAEPWAKRRACVAIDRRGVRIAPRCELPATPRGDLLQAGPLLVADGRPLSLDGADPEGFSSASEQFDSDITLGRYPRAALGITPDRLVAVACDGRSQHDAGLTLAELAALMADLGCVRALNLDGGGSTSLVIDGRLVNRPREEHGIELVAGRPVTTALVLSR